MVKVVTRYVHLDYFESFYQSVSFLVPLWINTCSWNWRWISPMDNTRRWGCWIGVFATIREGVLQMLIDPLFFSYELIFFSILWINKQIINNNGCTNTLPNKLFTASHMQMKQHSPNMIYKTLHQYKHSFKHAPWHRPTKIEIYFVLSKL